LISDRSLITICEKSAQSLEELVIRNSDCLSNQGLLRGLNFLKNLTHLDLSYTNAVDDKLIYGMLENTNIISSLEKLSLRLLK